MEQAKPEVLSLDYLMSKKKEEILTQYNGFLIPVAHLQNKTLILYQDADFYLPVKKILIARDYNYETQEILDMNIDVAYLISDGSYQNVLYIFTGLFANPSKWDDERDAKKDEIRIIAESAREGRSPHSKIEISTPNSSISSAPSTPSMYTGLNLASSYQGTPVSSPESNVSSASSSQTSSPVKLLEFTPFHRAAGPQFIPTQTQPLPISTSSKFTPFPTQFDQSSSVWLQRPVQPTFVSQPSSAYTQLKFTPPAGSSTVSSSGSPYYQVPPSQPIIPQIPLGTFQFPPVFKAFGSGGTGRL